MVNVRDKRCGEEGCVKYPSYGVAGSKKAEFCSKHAGAGMVNVVNKRCGEEGCVKYPSYGVAGSKKAEFCFKHARAGMVNVVNKRCGEEGCVKYPSYGVAGSKKAEVCSKHAMAGMVNVVSRRRGDENCLKLPSYDVAGSKKREDFSDNAGAGMVDVKRRRYHESCLKHSSYVVAESKEAEFCSEHARTGTVGIKHVESGKKGSFEPCTSKGHNREEAQCCQQHTSAHNIATVHSAAQLNPIVAISSRSTMEAGGGFVADVRAIKRKRDECPGSGSCAVVGTHRCVYAGHRRGVTTPQLLSAQKPSGADGTVCSEVKAGSGIKVEPAVPFPAHCSTWVRKCGKHASCSSGSSSVGVGNSSSSRNSGVGAGWLHGSSAMMSGCLSAFDAVQAEEAVMNSNVKLEPGVSSLPPWGSDR
ncbi:unnamed protein product [Sphacelaria rigidula]